MKPSGKDYFSMFLCFPDKQTPGKKSEINKLLWHELSYLLMWIISDTVSAWICFWWMTVCLYFPDLNVLNWIPFSVRSAWAASANEAASSEWRAERRAVSCRVTCWKSSEKRETGRWRRTRWWYWSCKLASSVQRRSLPHLEVLMCWRLDHCFAGFNLLCGVWCPTPPHPTPPHFSAFRCLISFLRQNYSLSQR